MSSIDVVGLDKTLFTEKQWGQLDDQFKFLDETIEVIFKTTFSESLQVKKVTVSEDKYLIFVELTSRSKCLIPALDIKMINFQSRKKIGLKEGDCVVFLKEVKNG